MTKCPHCGEDSTYQYGSPIRLAFLHGEEGDEERAMVMALTTRERTEAVLRFYREKQSRKAQYGEGEA